MENIKVNSRDFRVTMKEKNKLYEIYGKEYVNEIPVIYEELTKILNSNNTFSDMVYRGANNNNDCASALMEIYKLFENYKESKLYTVYCSITKILFIDYIYFILQKYMVSKEPALSDCMGVKDIPQCDFIIDRYHQFIDSLGVDAKSLEPETTEDGSVIINKGDLFHGTTYSEKVIESIANKGLESGQLHGVDEDGETFLCIDFFKATKDSTPDEICYFGKQYTNGPHQVVFVINNANINGDEAMFPELTDYDAYNETTEEGQKARKIVNVEGLPLDYTTGAAILIGVPPCMISSIIVNKEIEKDEEKLEFLSSHFPKATIVSRTSGLVIKKPIYDFSR